MLSLMLEPKFKNYSLIFCVIGHEQGVVIVQECDRNFLCVMLLKCHHCLHPLVESKGLHTKEAMIMKIVV
jgi:hypothetical protein